MKKRKSEISYMNVFFCMGVILIHVLSDAVTDLPHDAAAYTVIYNVWRMLTCAVPGFIFLSGLKLSLKPITDYKRFYLRRVTSVLIPYLIWMPIYYYFSWKWHYYPEIGVKDFFIKLADGTSTAHFYFIIVILQFYIMMPLWQLITKKLPALPVLIVCAVITCWSQAWLPVIAENNGITLPVTNDRLFINYLLAWACGCYCGAYYDKAAAMVKKLRYLIYAVFLILAAADLSFVHYVNKTGEIYLQLYYVNSAYAIAAIFAVMAVMIRLSERIGMGSCAALLDRSSYYIYLVHLLVLMAAREVVNNNFAEMGVLNRTAVYFVSVYGVSIFASVIYTAAKDKVKINYR
ncbi:MAG: acyltransferase [bacterium]|nr:acyltransferase [bacterium]